MASANKVKQYFVNHFRGQTASFMCLPMQLVKLNVDINVNLCIMPSKLLLYIFYKNVYALRSGVSGNSRSLPFPRMKASDSLSRFMEMDFFIPFPFPNFGNAFFFIPFPFPNYGNCFFHSLPVPELWEWIFSFPSHSRICYFTDGNQNGNWITVRDTRPPIFSASSTFLKTIILRR